MHGFVNEPTAPDSLPQLDNEAFEPVDRNYLRVALLGLLTTAVLAVVAVVLLLQFDVVEGRVPLLVAGGAVAVLAIVAAIRTLEVRNIAYQVRTHDISFRSGVLVKTVSTVPFVRVQHARIRQGPVHRQFGIATLEVSSAGPDVHIRGLASETAERLKVLVVQRAGDLVEPE